MSETANNFVNIQNHSDTSVDLERKTKIQKEWPKTPHQKYIGEALHGYLHGRGFYFVEEGEKLFYDGLFYANKLDGYAQVFYNDGSNFQGLFKNNVRFGPGVFTYPNGEQDVGLWSGQRLLRLASLNIYNLLPRLASTSSGQLKLLKYRYLVPVCPKPVDVASDILQRLGASDSVLQRSHELYNLEVGNKHNLFFNKKLFNDQFYDDQDFSIEVALTDEEDDSYMETQKPTDSNVNQDRVEQLTEGIDIVESKLLLVKEKRTEVQKRVDFCKICCNQERIQEESTASPEEPYENDENADERSMESGLSFFIGPPVTPKTAFTNTQERQQSVSLATVDINIENLFITDEEMSSFISFDSEVQDESDTDVMSQIKNYLKDTCGCNEAMYVEDLYVLEKELQALVKDELFFESIYNNLKVKLEKHLRQSQNARKVKTKKIPVNYVLSWNNEKYCIRMLKQSFLHRKSEYMVNFKVSDIIAGNRNEFENPGRRERNCADFLSACSNGDIRAIYGYIKKNDIDVNVCDAKGNNGVFFAAKHNHVDVIKVLMNLGAKLDQENDEGLLPLSMCLLTLLARKHYIENWEQSFLPDVEPFREREEPYKWYSNMSLLDILVRNQGSPTPSRKTLKAKIYAKASDIKLYLFDTSFIDPSAEKQEKLKEILVQKKMSFAPPPVHKGSPLIENTISTLLKFGANPNAGEVPLPPLFLSLFTEEPSVVESILEAHADVQTTIDDDMTCLHVIASLHGTRANVCICHLLLSYDCDPRQKTSPNHWKKQKMKILGKHVDPRVVEDHGKNPLHILCLRTDFTRDHCSYFHDMVMNFRDSFIDFNDRYLGHTPLSLAVLTGNKNLVEALMKLRIIDPHQLLDYDMGNVLTIYTLKRYEDMIPPNAQEILDYLVQMGVNVLTPVAKFENSIEFMEKQHEGKRKKSIGTNVEDKTNQTSQKTVLDYMPELGRETILKCIQLLTVENLYNLIENDFVRHKCVSILAKYLTPSQVITNLQLLFNHGKIHPDRFDRNICLKLIDIVRRTPKKEMADPISDPTDYGYILNMTDFTRMEKDKGKLKLLPPGLDDISKYKVCFHCLRNRGKDLIVCPTCQLIHFCSISCNQENLRLDLHPCGTDFYQSEQIRLNSPHSFLAPKSLAELFQRVREDCKKRRLEKLQKTLELQKKQFEEEMKSDTYGTKLLKYNLARSAMYKTPTLDSLVGSVLIAKSENYDRDITESVVTEKMYSGSIRWDLSSKELIKKKSYSDRKLDLSNRLDHKKRCRKKGINCHCKECTECKKEDKLKIECKCRSTRSKTRININTVRETEDMNIILMKLRVIPQRCQGFIKLLTRHFPDIDFSSLLLPYACYSNGHLYYNFLDDSPDRTYNMM